MRVLRRRLLGAALLAAPLAAQEPPATTSTSARVEFTGSLLLSGFYTDAAADARDVPTYVLLPPTGVDPISASGGTLRQSRVIIRGRAERFFGGTVSAEVDVDFAGDGERSPTPRLRRAVATVRWPYGWVLFGQEVVPISDLDPSSFAAVAVPGFTHTGNLSLWMPQVRLGAMTGGSVGVGAEVAAIAPRFADDDQSERVHRPFLQARLLAHWGPTDFRSALGIGGHYGWIMGTGDTLIATQAVGVTTRFFLSRYLEIRGEGFYGEVLATLGGGIGQNLGPDEKPVTTRGGWAQLILHPTPRWEVGGGYGFENPDDVDVDPVSGMLKNVTWETHAAWRPRPLVLALEYRRLETSYPSIGVDLLATANHVNVALGFEF